MVFRFGVSDGLANAVKHAFNVGMAGKGIVPGRPDDTFGIGWSRVTFSDDLLPLLRQRLDLGLDHEDAIEMYYNAAITRSLGVSLDLQIVEPGLKKTLSSSGRLEDVNTAVVGAPPLHALLSIGLAFGKWHLDFNLDLRVRNRKAVCGHPIMATLHLRAGWLAVS